MRIPFSVFFFLFCYSSSIFSQNAETILVTATRLENSSKEVSNSFTVISEKEIQQKKALSIDALLTLTPSLQVQRNGGPGQASSVFVRGAKSEHTLVLIDGMMMNDPLTPSRSFDFSSLSLDNVERIEIIRGPQSVLYGSDAIGGVIHIITKKHGTKNIFQGETGAYNTQNYSLSTRSSAQKINWNIASSYLKSDGFSAAAKQFGNTENDAYQRFTLAPYVGIKINDKSQLEWNSRFIKNKADTDAFGGVGGDQIGSFVKSTQLFSRLQSQNFFQNDSWESITGFSFSKHNRSDNTNGDAFFHSTQQKLDWQNNIFLSKISTLTAALELQQEAGQATDIFGKKDILVYGTYTQYKLQTDSWFGTLGARTDTNSVYGNSFTYRLAPGYIFSKYRTKIKTNYGTGFKAPSLYQLYSIYGSTALNSEKSFSTELGAEQELTKKISVEINYFNNQFLQLIDFDNSTMKYKNITRAETYGLEMVGNFAPFSSLEIKLNYTLQRARDKTSGAYLNRRPRNSYSVKGNYNFGKGNIGIDSLFVGKRNDGSRQLPQYYLIHANINYSLHKEWLIFSRLENIFNRSYEEVSGYGTPERSFYLGMQVVL